MEFSHCLFIYLFIYFFFLKRWLYSLHVIGSFGICARCFGVTYKFFFNLVSRDFNLESVIRGYTLSMIFVIVISEVLLKIVRASLNPSGLLKLVFQQKVKVQREPLSRVDVFTSRFDLYILKCEEFMYIFLE